MKLKLSPLARKKSLRVSEVSDSNLLWPSRPGLLPVRSGATDMRQLRCVAAGRELFRYNAAIGKGEI